jgi:hypothetical protein
VDNDLKLFLALAEQLLSHLSKRVMRAASAKGTSKPFWLFARTF